MMRDADAGKLVRENAATTLLQGPRRRCCYSAAVNPTVHDAAIVLVQQNKLAAVAGLTHRQ